MTAIYALRCAEGQVVNREGTEIEPHEDRALLVDGIEQPEQVAGDLRDVVGGDIRRGVSLPHAAHVRRDGAEARLRDDRDLVPPTEPEMREAVAQDHRHAGALLHVVHADAVDPRVAVNPLCHRALW